MDEMALHADEDEEVRLLSEEVDGDIELVLDEFANDVSLPPVMADVKARGARAAAHLPEQRSRLVLDVSSLPDVIIEASRSKPANPYAAAAARLPAFSTPVAVFPGVGSMPLAGEQPAPVPQPLPAHHSASRPLFVQQLAVDDGDARASSSSNESLMVRLLPAEVPDETAHARADPDAATGAAEGSSERSGAMRRLEATASLASLTSFNSFGAAAAAAQEPVVLEAYHDNRRSMKTIKQPDQQLKEADEFDELMAKTEGETTSVSSLEVRGRVPHACSLAADAPSSSSPMAARTLQTPCRRRSCPCLSTPACPHTHLPASRVLAARRRGLTSSRMAR